TCAVKARRQPQYSARRRGVLDCALQRLRLVVGGVRTHTKEGGVDIRSWHRLARGHGLRFGRGRDSPGAGKACEQPPAIDAHREKSCASVAGWASGCCSGVPAPTDYSPARLTAACGDQRDKEHFSGGKEARKRQPI